MDFSFENFVSEGLSNEAVRIAATLLNDGDYYVITPLVGAQAYRIPKSLVRVEEAGAGLDSSDREIRWVEIDPAAPCIAMNAGLARDMLAAAQAASVQKATITFEQSGEGNISFGGNRFPCLGRPALAYARDLTVKGEIGVDKFEKRYSQEFGVWMPYAILIMGQRGIFIHEGLDNLEDNGGPSQGCIHLATGNAKTFYDWVGGPTRILINYPW